MPFLERPQATEGLRDDLSSAPGLDPDDGLDELLQLRRVFDRVADTLIQPGEPRQRALAPGLPRDDGDDGIWRPGTVNGTCQPEPHLALDPVETMLQWVSRSATARAIDREIGDLGPDLLCREPVLTYQRYNVALTSEVLNGELELGFDGRTLDALKEMDDPSNVPALERVGQALATRVLPEHFPSVFDLGAEGWQ